MPTLGSWRMKQIFGQFRSSVIDTRAKLLWDVYSAGVGGVAFNGDPLPDWDTFAADPAKTKQVDGYRAMAKATLEAAAGEAIELAIVTLNRAFVADPNAVHSLICNRVPCNDELAEDPTIVCDAPGPINGEKPHSYQVGALGLINGVLGDITGGLAVAVKFGDPDPNTAGSKILGFQVYTPAE